VSGAIPAGASEKHHAKFMTLMWFDRFDGVRQFISEDYQAAPVPAQAQAVLGGFRQAPGALRGTRPPGTPL
jgi:hypothetical protein